ncbi:MAG: hypothetical protein ACRC6M_13765, partial [Microcystaceae cyanobacterium]
GEREIGQVGGMCYVGLPKSNFAHLVNLFNPDTGDGEGRSRPSLGKYTLDWPIVLVLVMKNVRVCLNN